MSSVWEQVQGGITPRSSLDGTSNNTPKDGAVAMSTALSSSPQPGSALQQRKDEHAHRKRNRIVVYFLVYN